MGIVGEQRPIATSDSAGMSVRMHRAVQLEPGDQEHEDAEHSQGEEAVGCCEGRGAQQGGGDDEEAFHVSATANRCPARQVLCLAA